MAVSIHPSSVVDPAACLGEDISIGPFCVVGRDVELGDRVRLTSHVVIDGRTRIGADTIVYPFASLGQPPQDLKYRGEPSELVIGRRNRIREHVTMNLGTEGGGMITRVGDDCLIMTAAHVAHDCILGNHVILANNATLGGHVEIDDHVIVGGMSAVHQFVRIGAHAMIGGMSALENDVIPYGLVMGERARLAGLNLVGLERRGFAKDDVRTLRAAYRALFQGKGTLAERLEHVSAEFSASHVVTDVLSFIRSRNNRSLCMPRQENAG